MNPVLRVLASRVDSALPSKRCSVRAPNHYDEEWADIERLQTQVSEFLASQSNHRVIAALVGVIRQRLHQMIKAAALDPHPDVLDALSKISKIAESAVSRGMRRS